ncbi:MAG: class I SAM-dependent methyltransferase [Kiritimatiellae bacterium]|nr:class I SAM-dependent methyltransferase [Kiritimatiellia bacterium]MDD4735819.1 class I SAM-dependent methyltransferase [Kiritimatiellia bacterium]
MINYNEQFKVQWRKCRRHPKTPFDWSGRAATIHPEPFLENSYTRTFLEKVDLTDCRSILDLGCGVGNLLIPLALRLDQGWGVDYAAGMLEVARKHAEEYEARNIEWIEADWRDEAQSLPKADLVLASRSVDAEDMQAALTRLNGLAARRVCLTYRVGRSYLAESLLEAVGREVPPRPDHDLLMNILEQMGLRAHLDFIHTEKCSNYESTEALLRRVEWTLGGLSADEAKRLECFYETLPQEEDGTRRHDHAIIWAFIGWEKE